MSSRNSQSTDMDTNPSAEKQQRKIKDVRKMVGQLSDDQLFSDASVSRYLTAQNWNSRKASKMLKETLKWRMQYKPEKICWEDVKQDAKTGKIYRSNYLDKFGRPVLVMRPGLQHTSSTKDQIMYLVYCLENAISNMPEGQEQMVWLIDFEGWNMSSVSLKTAHETARVLQNHYPERLGLVILYNPPKFLESFSTMVKPFFEIATRNRVSFVYSDNLESQKIMRELFDIGKLESAFDGDKFICFDYEEFARRKKNDDQRKSTLLRSEDPVLEQKQSVELQISKQHVIGSESKGNVESADIAPQESDSIKKLSDIGEGKLLFHQDGGTTAGENQHDVSQISESAS